MRVTVTKTGKQEHIIQAGFFTWARLQEKTMPALRLLFAIPNGAYLGGDLKTLRNGSTVSMGAIRMNRLKAEGLKPGVPDVFLPVARGGKHGLFLEFKRPKGGKHSEGQKLWRDLLQAAGYAHHSPTTLDEAIGIVTTYLKGPDSLPLPVA